jgi:uncharacterized protein with PIN domain
MGTIFARIFESRLSRAGPAVVSELRRMGCARALRERGVPGVRRSGDLLLRASKTAIETAIENCPVLLNRLSTFLQLRIAPRGTESL